MKKHLLLGVCMFLSIIIHAQVSTFPTYTFYTSQEISNDQFSNLQNHFISGYPEKVSSFTFDVSDHAVFVTTYLTPLDVLQIMRIQGIEAIYFINSYEKFSLSPNGKYLKRIKI